ncbi:hypothetical protein ACFV1D_18680, partial [Streptomyces mirabilis]
MSEHSVRNFYDELAHDYHLMFRDWDASMAYQAEVLGGLVRESLGAGPHTVLDCSCGIGTQAIGLALAGHQVVGGGHIPRRPPPPPPAPAAPRPPGAGAG